MARASQLCNLRHNLSGYALNLILASYAFYMAKASQVCFNCLDNDLNVKDFLVMAFNFMYCHILPHRKLSLNKLL